jgi:hypothetical protein
MNISNKGVRDPFQPPILFWRNPSLFKGGQPSTRRPPHPGEEIDVMPRPSLVIGFLHRIDDEICAQIPCVFDCADLERRFCLGSKITPAEWNITLPGIFVLNRDEIVPVNQPIGDVHCSVDFRLFGHGRIRSVVLR